MATQQRILTDDAPSPRRHLPLAPSPESAWSVVGFIGVAFTVVGGWDVVLAWVPARFGSPEWEFGTVTQTLDSLPLLTMGLVLSAAASLAAGTRWAARPVAVVLIVLAAILLVAGLMYATNVPLALRSLSDPTLKVGLKKAIEKTGVQALVYCTAYTWIAVRVWRLSR